MASSAITSWQRDGGKVETVTDFIFLGSKITVDGDCSHEIKRMLAPWKKSYDKPRQHIKKQRHPFVDKALYSQSYVWDSDCPRIPLLWYSNRKILSTFSASSRWFLPKVKSIHLHDIFRAEHKSYGRHCPASKLYSRGKSVNRSVGSNSLQSHGLQPPRLLSPWNFSDKNTEVGCHFLLQGIFLGIKPRSPPL